MEKVQPIAPRLDPRQKLEPASGSDEITVYLAASDLGDGNENDMFVWERPRLVAAGRPDLLLRDVRRVTAELAAQRLKLFANVSQALAAASEASRTPDKIDVRQLAGKHGLQPAPGWLEHFNRHRETVRIQGHYGPRRSPATMPSGWSPRAADAGGQCIRPARPHPRQHVSPQRRRVHPTPEINAVVGWQSPIAGDVKVSAVVSCPS
jgi:hypothetical protein